MSCPLGLLKVKGLESFVARFQVPSRKTITRDCTRLYNDEKMKVKAAISGQRLCLTTDTWTSVQNLNYMCLTAHYIDSDWNYNKKILGFNIVERHKGEVLGKAIEMCLLDWGVYSIFTVTVDNASSNNGAIAHLKKKTKGWSSSILSHEFIHMRCCAHILNLVVSNGLKECSDSFEKIRNAIRFVRSSPARLASFKKCVEKQKISSNAMLCLDVPTRWNSTYLMLDTALKYQKAFERLEEDEVSYMLYFMDNNRYMDEPESSDAGSRRSRRAGPPLPLDFETADVLVKFLKLFYEATIKFSGSTFVTSNACFVELAVIQNKINLHSNSDDVMLRTMALGMRTKFDKYWGNISKTNMLLYVAVILDPRRKLNYLKFCFMKLMDKESGELLLEKVSDALYRLYGWFAGNEPAPNGQATYVHQEHGAAAVSDLMSNFDALEVEFLTQLKAEASVDTKSELDQYLLVPCLESDKNFDILSWWKINCSRYPILSKLARVVLAVPVSTVASESTFSTGGRILDPFRSSLNPMTVEALICTLNWIKSPSHAFNLRNTMDYVAAIEELGTKLAAKVIID